MGSARRLEEVLLVKISRILYLGSVADDLQILTDPNNAWYLKSGTSLITGLH